MKPERPYLPAAGKTWFLPLYDPLVKFLGVDKDRNRIAEHADLKPGQTVLDIGCGTGSLMVQIAKLYPGVKIFGLDPDPGALARANKKAAKRGVDLSFNRGFSDELPYPDNSFDIVFFTFVFHHIRSTREKEKTLAEVKRVLKCKGAFYLLDAVVPGVRKKQHDIFSSGEQPKLDRSLENNSEAQILFLLNKTRFSGWEKIKERKAFFGRIISIKATAK